MNKKPQSNLGRAASPPLTLKMDSSARCATSCAMPLQTSPVSHEYATLTPQCCLGGPILTIR